jgi:hypothetical protein
MKTKDSKEDVLNVEKEVIRLLIVKERRIERRIKSLTNPNQKDHKALKVLSY